MPTSILNTLLIWIRYNKVIPQPLIELPCTGESIPRRCPMWEASGQWYTLTHPLGSTNQRSATSGSRPTALTSTSQLARRGVYSAKRILQHGFQHEQVDFCVSHVALWLETFHLQEIMSNKLKASSLPSSCKHFFFRGQK